MKILVGVVVIVILGVAWLAWQLLTAEEDPSDKDNNGPSIGMGAAA